MQQIAEKQLPNYVLGSLGTSAVRWNEIPKAFDEGFEWYRHLTGLGHYHMPLYLILDLGLLIEHGYETPFASDRDYKQWPEAHRAIRLRYENELLGRLLQEPMMLEILEFLQLQEQRDGRRLRLMELLLKSLAPHYPRELLLHPGHIRQLQVTPNDVAAHPEKAEAFFDVVENDDFFIEQLNTYLDNVARNIKWSELLRPEDLFELQYWTILDTEEIRIGCRQILEVERRLGEIDTRRVNLTEEDSDAETAFVDETYYPTGGLTELTNRGSFENLVLSELTYIEDDDDIDLVDVRFVEGELLFYKRDSGQLRRKRRTVHLIIDLGDIFQLKTGGYDYQFSILTQGLLLRITRDLLTVFANDSMQFHFHYLTHDLDPEPVKREMKLMRLLLADEEQHGWVHFHLHETLDPTLLEEHKRKVYAVAITGDGTTWKTMFEEYQFRRPAILGVPVFVNPDAKPPEEDESFDPNASQLEMPLKGMGFSHVVSLKDHIVTQVAGLRAR
jgi:hypothetical protein